MVLLLLSLFLINNNINNKSYCNLDYLIFFKSLGIATIHLLTNIIKCAG